MIMTTPAIPVELLRLHFGDAVQENVSLAPYTSARIGGPADVLVTVKSADELADVMKVIWEHEMPYYILGGGSNVLVSDKGVRGVVVLNRAKEVRFESGDQPTVWCEAGVVFSNLANRCASKGMAGLEWAATVPGTIGGAVYGNAGAFGGDISENLIWAELLTKNGREKFSVEQMGYGYRTSILKRGEINAIVLSALLRLKNSNKEEVSVKIEAIQRTPKGHAAARCQHGFDVQKPGGRSCGPFDRSRGFERHAHR